MMIDYWLEWGCLATVTLNCKPVELWPNVYPGLLRSSSSYTDTPQTHHLSAYFAMFTICQIASHGLEWGRSRDRDHRSKAKVS